ncbi:hypothetical protein GCM10010121_093880 [Streptomyces brasiliensis]|uniref:Uncharacterized protein n=1 Tax=Streptomyces brasiliensis TaxID=1954 RepID=A0A917PA67_9ACTN|nr:hypothetical protein GCM10010121_093880 [Streptomyces brasiliensis]
MVQGLDLPMPTDQFGKLGRGGLLGGEAGDRIDRLDGGLPGRAIRATALDLDGLDGVRKKQTRLDRADFEAAYLASPVRPFVGAVLKRDLAPPGVA